MSYLKFFGLALLIMAVLVLLYWGLCIWVHRRRYRKALNRRVREIDAEMKKRGGMF